MGRGYQKRLMADLNLDPPNSKTLVQTLRVTLRDASQKKTKPLSGVLGGRSSLAPARTFSHLFRTDKVAVIPIQTLGTRCKIAPGRGWSIRGCRPRQPHPTSPNARAPTRACKELGVAIPHNQRNHHLLDILLYKAIGLYMTQILFS